MGLDIYKRIDTIKDSSHKSIYIVKNEMDHLLYIQRRLDSYDIKIYEKLREINSPLLPKIYELIEKEDELYIIEEYINAPTLKQVLINNELKHSEINNLMVEICDALCILHERDIIHRDVKADNILYYKGHIVLFDFDISRGYVKDQALDTHILGSVGYAAPEQFGFTQSDARTDIYALGVLYHYMLTLRLPTDFSLTGKAAKIVKKAIEIDPNNRYQSVKEFKYALTGDSENYKMLGYKSDSILIKALASIIYGILLLGLFVSEVEGCAYWSFMAWYTKLYVLGGFVIMLVFVSNYKNIYSFCLGYDNKNRFIRYGGILFSWIMLEAVYTIVLGMFL